MKSRKLRAPTVLTIISLIIVVLAPTAAASKFKTLYTFSGGSDGDSPRSGLILDKDGNLYGTTFFNGQNGCGAQCGTVFKLTRNPDGSMTESVLYSFSGNEDGADPAAELTFDAAGNLYGTTLYGGENEYHGGCGVVFELTPNDDGNWTQDVLYASTCGMDGVFFNSRVIFDAAGNLYGTLYAAGLHNAGEIFKLTLNPDASWTKSVVYSFTGGADGLYPSGGIIFDAQGNLYGTTTRGGIRGNGCDPYACGNVFKVTPNPDGSWSEQVLYTFKDGADGALPVAGLIFDQSGNLYGTTSGGGSFSGDCAPNGCGVVFKLTPNPDGSWTETILHTFSGGRDGAAPAAGLVFDPEGSLYGTCSLGGINGYGGVFRLTPDPRGRWKEAGYAFRNNPGAYPKAVLTLDDAGNLYGTTSGDGITTFGTVFEITP